MWALAVWAVALAALLAAGCALHRLALPSRLRALLVALLALAGGWLTWQLSDPIDALLYADYAKAYHWAGRQALVHPERLYPATGEEIRFVNLPLVALAFAPLARLAPRTGALALDALGVLAVVAGYFLLARLAELSPRGRALLALALAMNGPLHNSLRLGNTTELALPMLAGALLCLRRERDAAAGALLALAGVLKLPLLLLGAWLAARRRWRAAAGFGATLAATVGLSLLVFGWKPHADWYRACIAPFLGHAMAAYNVQSLDGFLARLSPDADASSWALVPFGPGARALRLLLVGGLAALCVEVCRRAGRPRSDAAWGLELSLALCFALVASAISWSHYYLLLWLPLALLLRDGARPAVLLAALLVSLPVAMPEPAIARDAAVRLAVSYPLAGGLLLLGLLLRARARAAPMP